MIHGGANVFTDRHAISNTLAGVIIFYVGLAPAIHYSGAWFSSFLPMSDALTYDNRGAQYNVSRVLTKSFVLDEEAYKAYSPVFIRLVHFQHHTEVTKRKRAQKMVRRSMPCFVIVSSSLPNNVCSDNKLRFCTALRSRYPMVCHSPLSPR
jgi:hypothetical protein